MNTYGYNSNDDDNPRAGTKNNNILENRQPMEDSHTIAIVMLEVFSLNQIADVAALRSEESNSKTLIPTYISGLPEGMR